MRQRSQQIDGAPAPDQHVAFGGKLENLLGGAARHAPAIDAPALKQRGLAFEKTMHLVFGQVRMLNDLMFDKLVVDEVEPEPFGEPGCDILAERGHFARHRYNGHGNLPGTNSLRPAPFASASRYIILLGLGRPFRPVKAKAPAARLPGARQSHPNLGGYDRLVAHCSGIRAAGGCSGIWGIARIAKSARPPSQLTPSGYIPLARHRPPKRQASGEQARRREPGPESGKKIQRGLCPRTQIADTGFRGEFLRTNCREATALIARSISSAIAKASARVGFLWRG